MPSFRTEKFIFVHVPKTGGMWFYHTCRQFGIPILEQGPDYDSHKAAAFFKRYWEILPWVAVYRNPMDWYTSLYNYHVKTDWWWKPQRKGMKFHDFVELCLMTKSYSQGWYEMVIKPKQFRKNVAGELRWFPPTYMIQYENMYEELEIVMRGILGYEQFTQERLVQTRKINTRSMRGFRGTPAHSHCPALTPKLREKILEADAPIFEYYRKHDVIVAEW